VHPSPNYFCEAIPQRSPIPGQLNSPFLAWRLVPIDSDSNCSIGLGYFYGCYYCCYWFGLKDVVICYWFMVWRVWPIGLCGGRIILGFGLISLTLWIETFAEWVVRWVRRSVFMLAVDLISSTSCQLRCGWLA
jgi:hypothetical protein